MTSGTPESIWDLPPELLPKLGQINEDPQTRQAGLDKLKELLQEERQSGRHPDIGVELADASLVGYLRCRKHNVDKALGVLIKRYEFFQKHADLVANITGNEFQEKYARGLVRVLDGTDKEGRRIFCVRPSNLDGNPEVFMLRWNVWMLDRLLPDPYFQVNGLIMLENFAHASLKDAAQVMRAARGGGMARMMYYIQECAPCRLGGLLAINMPSFILAVFNIVKMFLGKKLRQRVHLLGKRHQKLQQFVDKEHLPEDFGGTRPMDASLVWYAQQIALDGAEDTPAEPHKHKDVGNFMLEDGRGGPEEGEGLVKNAPSEG